MISSDIDLDTSVQEEIRSEFRVCKGHFVAVARPQDGHYEFLIRDLRREGPTIYGSGVDLTSATAAVTRLLNALIRKP